jgi:hypothetical protein
VSLTRPAGGIAADLRRGVLAGLLAGLLAGVFALTVAAPAMEAALAHEAGHAHGDTAAHGHGDAAVADHEDATFSRATQRVGLVVGTAVFGAAMGAVFGVAAAWAAGRLHGDAWRRSLTLGVAVSVIVVLLPAIAYPPNPPGVGDPDLVAARSVLYLLVIGVGLFAAAGAWWVDRVARARGMAPAAAGTVAIVGAAVVAGTIVAALPDLPTAQAYPADLMWRFRLGSVGTQLVLWGGLAVIHGLLAIERPVRAGVPTAAGHAG